MVAGRNGTFVHFCFATAPPLTIALKTINEFLSEDVEAVATSLLRTHIQDAKEHINRVRTNRFISYR